MLRYLMVGGTAFVLELSTLYTLNHIVGLGPVQSVAISFWVGFIIAFILQKLITFRNYETHMHVILKQVIGYTILVAWNYAFTIAAVKILSREVSVLIIRTGVIVLTTTWNYLLYHQLFKISAITHAEKDNQIKN